MPHDDKPEKPLVAVIGNGIMGHGIAEVFATAGHDVVLIGRTCSLLRGAGKSPVVINREIDGFIGNRLQFALLREAWALWADGVASASAIDAVVRQSIGRRLGITGPLESADLGGIETMVSFAKFLLPTLDVSKEPPERVKALASSHHEKG